MAGMLPGVESARRRRFHPSDSSSDCPYFTRRSPLCLYSSNHESLLSASSLQQRSVLYQGRSDEKLAGAAGEAKERLEERLRSAQMRSSNKRQNIKEEKKNRDGRQELHIEVGDTLIHLPCAHRFHCSCLDPGYKILVIAHVAELPLLYITRFIIPFKFFAFVVLGRNLGLW
ncbi:hypothetical protein K1719_003393 [Acacia pycnantha]|nr:hypothetical protein K1719_003393 [Acacia pycnantha]